MHLTLPNRPNHPSHTPPLDIKLQTTPASHTQLISLPFHPPLTPRTRAQPSLLYGRGEMIFTSVLETCEEAPHRSTWPLILFFTEMESSLQDLSNHALAFPQETLELPPLSRPCSSYRGWTRRPRSPGASPRPPPGPLRPPQPLRRLPYGRRPP
jgi:hypothetical protein